MAIAVPFRMGRLVEDLFNNTYRLRMLEQRTAQLEQYQTMQHAITQIIARSTELDTAIPRIIQIICEVIGWDLGEVWHVDPDSNSLFCQASWHTPTGNFPTFTQSSYDTTFNPGIGLPGRVWASGKPAWMTDVVLDSHFMRGAMAQRDGLHAGLGIPIRAEGETIGVLTFFSRRIHHADRELLNVLDTIGSQIGLFIERKRFEDAERKQTQKLAALEERQRIARDLHDSVTQTLFSASVIAEMLPQIWDRNPDQARVNIEELQQLTRGALAEMRSLLVEMRPTTPPNANLSEMLRKLVDATTEHTKIKITLEAQGRDKLTPETQLALYRITQEALNNVVKHAAATHVHIQLCLADRMFELHIRDNGIGFKTDNLPVNHFGLGIMRERAEEIGATFQFTSAPHQGTHLVIAAAV